MLSSFPLTNRSISCARASRFVGFTAASPVRENLERAVRSFVGNHVYGPGLQGGLSGSSPPARNPSLLSPAENGEREDDNREDHNEEQEGEEVGAGVCLTRTGDRHFHGVGKFIDAPHNNRGPIPKSENRGGARE